MFFQLMIQRGIIRAVSDQGSTNRLREGDVAALLGLVAVLESELMIAEDLPDAVPGWA